MFRKYITESIADKTGVNLDNLLVQFTLESFNMVTQAHIYHLLTKSYAEHIAIGDFYESLGGCIDIIAETAIGMDIEVSASEHNYNLQFAYTRDDLRFKLADYRNLVSTLIEKTNNKNIMSINDKLINIQQLIDNLNYKLELS